MYVIEKGVVEIHRSIDGHRHLVAALTHGEFFGEMAIVSQRAHSATAEVREDARLLEITAEDLLDMLQNKAEISARIIKALVKRLEQANRKLELLLIYVDQHPEHTPTPSSPSPPTPEAQTSIPSPTPAELKKREAAEQHEVDDLWAKIRDVIIDKDYRAALDYLYQAKHLRPDDPKISHYMDRLQALSEMNENTDI